MRVGGNRKSPAVNETVSVVSSAMVWSGIARQRVQQPGFHHGLPGALLPTALQVWLAPVVGSGSRVMLGVHWLTDVLGGFVLGTSWLLLCLALHGRFQKRFALPRRVE